MDNAGITAERPLENDDIVGALRDTSRMLAECNEMLVQIGTFLKIVVDDYNSGAIVSRPL